MEESVFASLTVFFEDPFWVGVFERLEDGELTASRVVFGSEPKDYEVFDRFLEGWGNLRFTPPVPGEQELKRHQNPKRARREADACLSRPGTGTKAQQALALQREEGAKSRKESRKERREAQEERKFLLRQQKRKDKHRGR